MKIKWAKQQGTHCGNTGNPFVSTNTFPHKYVSSRIDIKHVCKIIAKGGVATTEVTNFLSEI
jgi:hypothetical protein